MTDYINGDKADLPGFISTNHTGSRGLKGYDDDTFDNINRKAFEAIKNSKIIDFYNETEADQIEDALAETLRGAEGDLTMDDALEGNARNFFTTLDLEDPNVMRAIGQYGFAQAISAGGMLKPVKALIFSKNPEGAENWKIKQLLEGLKDAQNTYYRDAAERILNAEYYSDMKGLIGDKIELTNNEHDAFGREFANWSNVNMPEIAVDEKGDLKGNVYYQLPKPGDKYIIGMANLDNEGVGAVLDVIRELNINKWKRLMKKAVNNLIKLDGAKPRVRGITEEKLQEIIQGAGKVEEELTRELNDLVDEVDESGKPKEMLAGRRGTRERVTPGDFSSDKPDFRRDFTADEPDKFDEKGRLITPVKDSYDPENPRVERDIQRIETVDVEDLTRELTPITKLKQFMDNSTIDVKVNKKSKVYTVTTNEEDWNLYEGFLGITDADRAVVKISNPGKFGRKMKINTGRHIEEEDEGLSVEIIAGMLETKEKSNRLFVNIKDTISSLLDDRDIILRYYKMVSKDKINDDEIEETIKSLEDYMGDLTEEELLDKLSNYNEEESEALKDVLRPFNRLFSKINDSFIDYTENVREVKEEQVRQDEEADKRGEEIEVEAETQEDRMSIRDNTAIKTFDTLLTAYENNITKLKNYESSDDSIEDTQEAMDEFLATPKGLPFKETYVDVLDGEDLNELNRPAVLQRLRKFYNLEEVDVDEDVKSIVESFIRDDIMQTHKLVDIFTVLITKESKNPKEWTQMAKYTSAGKIQFRLIFRASEAGVSAEAEIIYNQEFEIKPVLAESSRIEFTNRKQQAAASIDRRGGQKSMTALGREIKQNGFGIDKKRKEFIDKVVERLQQLEMVI